MKVKQQSEDFQVEELTDVVPAGRGPFAFYRLEKSGWATPDAVQAIRRRWGLNPRRLSYGGLKDKHAQTAQYFTIRHGPQRGLTHHSVALHYLGQVLEPYTSRHIKANRFRITLRALQTDEVAKAQKALEEVRVDGVPNYFDDQRFGSVGDGEEFVARFMILGRYEEALRLALTARYAHDRKAQKEEKAILLAHWGDWPACKERLPRSHTRRLVDYLVSHPTDFRGTLARMRPELRGLYLSAYQSYLWNRMLNQWVEGHCGPDQLLKVHLRLGDVAMHRRLEEPQRSDFANLRLPLPSARLKLEAGDPRAALIDAALAPEGLTLSEMKIRGLREPFFSKGERAALCLPAELTYESAADELHPGRQKMILSFDLPRGSYATLIVKRVQASVVSGES
jgi:tRNA pseudouridine13 synthase